MATLTIIDSYSQNTGRATTNSLLVSVWTWLSEEDEWKSESSELSNNWFIRSYYQQREKAHKPIDPNAFLARVEGTTDADGKTHCWLLGKMGHVQPTIAAISRAHVLPQSNFLGIWWCYR